MFSVLFLTGHPIEDASVRYRVYQFVGPLEKAGYSCTIAPFTTATLFTALQHRRKLATKALHTVYCTARRLFRLASLSKFDIVVIHREAFPFLAPLVERWILRAHPRIVFSFDDAVHIGHGDVSPSNHPWLYRAKYGKGYDEVIRDSAHVIAGNRILAEHASAHNANVTVIPTVIDCQHFRFRQRRLEDEVPVTIGWMGSRSTVRYLVQIEPVLRDIARVHRGRVRFRFFGASEYNLDVPDFRSLPFSLDRELQHLHSLDIGLMPMPDTEWTRGKCAFKAIQYMATGVATVASPVGITPDVIQNNVSGILANSNNEWFQALDRLISDAGLRERVAIAARHRIEQLYSLQVWGPRLISLFDTLVSSADVVNRDSVAA
jgi:glycosyltransferase involved in cell wall biosynthesis